MKEATEVNILAILVQPQDWEETDGWIWYNSPFLKKNIYLFIYFGCTGSQLWHTGSSLRHVGFLVSACGLLVAACGLLSCSVQASQLWHADFLVAACRLLSCSMWILVVTCRLLSCIMQTLSCGMHAGSSSLTRDRTQVPCIGSVESYPLDHQGSP